MMGYRRFLPKRRLFDSVALVTTIRIGSEVVVDYDHDFQFKIRKSYGLFVCGHENRGKYIRIDHRNGPGSYADNFEGTCCLDCGRILEEKQTL